MFWRYTFLCLMLGGGYACQKDAVKGFKLLTSSNLKTIYIDENANDSKLSDVFDVESCIILDTAAIIGTISKVIALGDNIYIGDFKNTKTVFCYAGNGLLRWKCEPDVFQKEGGILDFSVNEADNSLQVLCNRAICTFDDEGKFRQSLALNGPAGKLVSLGEGELLLYNYTSTGSKYKQLTLNGKLIAEGNASSFFCSHPVAGISDLNDAPFFGKAIHSEFLNDTIFYIDNQEIRPVYVIDLGNRKVKDTQKMTFKRMIYPDVMKELNHSGVAAGLEMVFETENVLHFSFLYKNRYKSIYYDKINQKAIQVGEDSDDLFLGAFGYIPFGVLSDDRFVFVLEPQTLHDSDKSNGEKKHPLIGELLKKTNGLSNPVLLIGKFKKQNHAKVIF